MSVELFFIIGITFIFFLLVVILLIPAGKKKSKRKKGPDKDQSVESKNRDQRISRLEKHIQSLRREILEFQKKEKDKDKQLTVEKVKVKKFQEKLSQERQWHEKEHTDLDKKAKEFQQLKTDLKNAQESFSKEHAANIRHERKIKELIQKNSSLIERRRQVESENSQLTDKIEGNRKDIAQLKKENIQLKKKNEDVNWIAKSEYERIEKLLREKEKKLERIERENEKK